jgi:hypothetical protein
MCLGGGRAEVRNDCLWPRSKGRELAITHKKSCVPQSSSTRSEKDIDSEAEKGITVRQMER